MYLKHIEYDEGLNIARGLVRGAYSVNKFGYNPSIPSNAFETVWDGSNLYPYISTAGTATVTSDDTASDNGGTVLVSGLDADYNEINETITLNGQTAVNTTKEYLRINRMIVRSAGSGGANAGVIYAGTGTVTTGVPANVYASVNGVTGANQSLMALWTVPAGYTAYLLQYDISNGTTSNTPAVCKLVLAVRPYGEVFQSKDVKSLTTGMHVEETFSIPIKIEEKSDIEVRALSSSNSVSFDISAAVEIIYIKNETLT